MKLDVFGPKEDMYYSAFPSLVKNIRRGNTLIKIFNEDGTKKNYIGRKGLMKFFDMRLSFVSKQERNVLHPIKYKEDLHQEKNYILAPVLKAIKQGYKVEVLKTLKANGENVQVSYSRETQAWVVSSKNVGMLVRNREDINKYKNGASADRFAFAGEMAHVWFSTLEAMSEALRKEITHEMSGRTLVGEYIGS